MTASTTVLDTFSAIEQRRAVKHYDPNFVMPEADEKKLLSLALLSPTSFNIQNWRFVNVKTPAAREALKEAAWGQAQITDACLSLVLCGDLNSWQDRPERYWQNVPDGVRDFLLSALHGFYLDRPSVQRDEVMRSCGIAAQTIMLAAKAMGYDSCPMVGFDPDKVAELINLPKDHVVSMIITVGKATKPAYERGGQLPMEDVVLTDRFQ